MELLLPQQQQNQQQRSCVLSTYVPAIAHAHTAALATQRGILQERSANWPHEYNTQSTSIKLQSRSPSPTEHKHVQRPPAAGNYFTGNIHGQQIGLAGFGEERSEKQVEYELNRLYLMLQRSDKYQKYREKQPVLTAAEFLAREAAEQRLRQTSGDKSAKDGKDDKAVWPEFLEHAFWRALVKWPPMGRKKYMLDGALRGRNELIQDSIRRDTGIKRDRKQVSSHLQVLKQHLRDHHRVLVYMGKPDSQRKHHRERASYHSHLDGRHHLHAPKYNHSATSTHLLGGHGPAHSSFALSAGPADGASRSPYAVESFSMFVEADDQHVHYFTELSSNARHRDLVVTDTTSWRLRYPEFNFLHLQTEDWVKQDQKVLVCEASLKIMTEPRPKANLSITFNVYTQRDLSVFKSIECTTRFYDSGNIAPDPLFDGVNANANDLKEHRTRCEYTPDPYGSNGRLRIAFGSKFWVNRMLKYQILRHKDEACVRNSLLRLTATQDIYGIKMDTGEAECVLTILWRFTQTTTSSAEVGSTHWRAVTFGEIDTPVQEQKWVTHEYHLGVNIEDDNKGHGDIIECSGTAPHDSSLYQYALHMPQKFQTSHHVYTDQTTHNNHTPELQLEIVGSMQPDLVQPHTSALPSTSTDYSQQSFLDRSHTQDTMGTYVQDNDDFDFNGGHITISGAFDSAVGLSTYESFADQSALAGLHTLTGLDPDGYSLGLACADGNELVGCENDLQDPANMTCYSTKPNWHHANLISSLENAAEEYQSYMTHDQHQTTHGHEVVQGYAGPSPALSQEEELVTHGLHDAHMNVHAGSWNLQSPFHEDTGSGAHGSGKVVDCRKNSVSQDIGKDSHPSGLGLGVLDLIEKDQRSRGY